MRLAKEFHGYRGFVLGIFQGTGMPKLTWVQLAGTLALVAAAAGGRLALVPQASGFPFITFFPAVALSAVLLGAGPAALTVFMGLCIGHLAFEPAAFATERSFSPWVPDAVFGFFGLVTCWQTHALSHRSKRERRSELRFRALFEHTSFAQVLVDPASLRIVQCNQAGARVLGYTREEMCGLTVRDIAVEFDEAIIEGLRQRVVAGETVQFETRERRKDGELRSMQVSVVLLDTEEGQRFHATHSDITDFKQAQDELRIAAKAFESPSGIAVMSSDGEILRVNQAFTEITGYSQEEARGKTSALLRSERNPASLHEEIWREVASKGVWTGEGWHRRKSGEEYEERSTVTTVRNEFNEVTHYVAFLTDATTLVQQEQVRLRAEADHRRALVREVHHRIKNNLQGVLGILRKYTNLYPQTAEPLQQAIAQVQAISTVHGLQGCAGDVSAPVGELVRAIASVVSELWSTPISVEILCSGQLCIVEEEMVPVALVLNELVSNAVKHGGQRQGEVSVSLRMGPVRDSIEIRISNAGQMPAQAGGPRSTQSGLDLVAALMPRIGAHCVHDQQGGQVVTLLQLEPPVLAQESDRLLLSERA
jgi:PAS domain S-box-containing protein